jgi:hypothetical protein
MRADALGMFWVDAPVVKVKKEKIKAVPPEPTWEEPTYLPFIDEARAFNVPLYTDAELAQAAYAMQRERFVFDIECYANYFLIAFKGIDSGKIIFFEFDETSFLREIPKLRWIMQSFTLISFNGNNYDMPMAALALAGHDTYKLKRATDMIITGVDGEEPKRPQDVLKIFKTKRLKDVDHIDLIEVAPLDGSLKVYAGRLHAERMQDLPYRPDTILTPDQKLVVRWYCINDLRNTELLYLDLKEAIDLREQMGHMYNVDLRSRSDAQIAESVIAEELHRMTGLAYQKAPEVQVGSIYKYVIPHYIQYNGANMRWVLETVRNAVFYVNESGRIGMPSELSDLNIPIGNSVYTMGIGGLHSTESTVAHKADENTVIVDRDVASYYPRIILNLGLYPKHLGVNFLTVYQSIVDRRLAAKASGDKLTAETLKITVNGSFGKTGNKYSMLYEPSLVVQTTITGQLSLLMLIERLELAGVPVISANTDGVVIKCPKTRIEDMNAIIAQWEKDTGFQTEEARYLALYSRDVNNYIAVKQKFDKVNKVWLNQAEDVPKLKGAYSEAGLRKNPQNEVCIDAVVALLVKGVPVATTISQCNDFRKFITVRRVRGGAVKDGVFLGGVVRWYYANDIAGHIVLAKSGNKVPKSEGAKPVQDMPKAFPTDINYDWYINEAYDILRDIGYMI